MTSYDVSDDIEAVVEDTELPRRLKERVYEAIESRDASTEQADEIARAVESQYLDTRVDPLDPVGTVSAQSIGEPGTQMTMNTFHYAGVAEIDVTQGLPRLIELVDARKTPDTPMMTVYLEDEYATDREKAHEVVWKIEATKVLALGDVSTNVADMRVQISLNEDTLEERMITPEEVAEIIQDNLGVEAIQQGTQIEFGPELQIAKTLVDECLNEWAEDARAEIRAIVTRAFNTDKEGQINRSEIFMLLRLDITDERWRRAMQAIRDAMRVTGSKSYIRFWMREAHDQPRRAITIDLASA